MFYKTPLRVFKKIEYYYHLNKTNLLVIEFMIYAVHVETKTVINGFDS